MAQTKNIRAAIAVAVITCLQVASLAPARAGDITENDGSVSQSVHTGDLDLTTPAGQTVLRQRVRAAARHVCMIANAGEPLGVAENRACVAEAQASAHMETVIAAARKRSVIAALAPGAAH